MAWPEAYPDILACDSMPATLPRIGEVVTGTTGR
ncbi:hypothetical protein HNP84_003556 [Thermocatellispora tengchongensis]|uniref:Uncharacterized protein n=1 Tax=Thermocatellispora tengchongensis TaxID=1073253 RepID=A0A840P8R7_9ACTN|nr:hypothetical protein [Thermocatellispora tengchongensis]